ncbi:MAG: GatB/YqeY domain-containing protein [Candidatus Saccharimonadales bacterium]
MLEQRLEQDIKAALLAGDSIKVNTLRGLKSALLYVKVAKGKKETGLSEAEVIAVFASEAKKRSESAELYIQGGAQDKADKELLEKKIIEAYLPKQLSEAEISPIVDKTISELGVSDISGMGTVIAKIREVTAGSADGSLIAKMVKERLSK